MPLLKPTPIYFRCYPHASDRANNPRGAIYVCIFKYLCKITKTLKRDEEYSWLN